MNNKIVSVHHLRGIAAIFVVFFHFRSFLNGVYDYKDLGTVLFGPGAFGVDLFFMISGFIISLATKKPIKASVFLTRRFFRIYPLFIFVFLIGAFTVYSDHSSYELIKSMLFIHNDYAQSSPGFGFNILGPAWTLSYEIYFYFIFMVAMTISHKHRVLISSFIIITPIITLQLLYSNELSLSASSSAGIPEYYYFYGLMRFTSSPMMIEFIIGMVLYEAFMNERLLVPAIAARASLTLSLVVFFGLYFFSKDYGFGIGSFGMWSLFLFSGVLIYDKALGFNESKLLKLLGDISFSIYMSHYLIIKALESYRPDWWWHSSGIIKFSMASVICITIATILHFIIEKPFIRYGKKLESHLSGENKSYPGAPSGVK